MQSKRITLLEGRDSLQQDMVVRKPNKTSGADVFPSCAPASDAAEVLGGNDKRTMNEGTLESVTAVCAAPNNTHENTVDLRFICSSLQDAMSKQADLLMVSAIEIMGSANTDRAAGANVLSRSAESCKGSEQKISLMKSATAKAQAPAGKQDLEYSSYQAFKKYSRGLKNSCCSRIGNASFFEAKREWRRLDYDFPYLSSDTEKVAAPGIQG